MHPLKTASLVFWFGLLAFQLSLLWPVFGVSYYWSLPLITMLLLPLPGLITGRIYTYRWIGFLTMLYFCVGISELMANPDLRLYALGTTLFSTLLFFTTIYFARRQASRSRD